MIFTLGGFTFNQDDLPETLTVGYTLKNTVIRLSDGSRFLQTFGAESDDITFSGKFIYGDAIGRAQQVEQLFLARAPIAFDCDFVHRQVLITKYQYVPHHAGEVDYTFTLYVAQDIPYALQDTRLANVMANAAAAQNAANNVGLPGMSASQTTLNNYMASAGLK